MKVLRIIFLGCSLILVNSAEVRGLASHLDPPTSPDSVLGDAHIFNLYWDTNWDGDIGEPQLSMARLDAFTAALVQSKYFSGLGQYGVRQVDFVGSALPDPSCRATAPVEAHRESIVRLIDCMTLSQRLPSTENLLVNVFLPQTTTINFSRPKHYCAKDLVAYHGSVFVGGVVFTVIPSACALAIGRNSQHTAMYWQTRFLTHELAEAVTNPYLNKGWLDRRSDWGEAADICDGVQGRDFVGGSLAAYWSNKDNACVFGW